MHKLALLALSSLALGACSKDKAKKPAPGPDLGSVPNAKVDPGLPKPSVVVTLSVDWEGAYLSEAGLLAMTKFRKKWGNTPLTHFICPAYFVSPQNFSDVPERIKEQVLDGDEVGLHVHSWFSLATLAGITPRNSPNFYADDTPILSFENGDRGYEVALSAYQPQELDALIAASTALLESNGLGKPTAFRSGGYVASPAVLNAVRSAGMHVDSSAAWSVWFDEAQGDFQSEIARMWPNLQELTQPYGIDTPAGAIIEVPNTGSFAEYASADEMLGHLQRAAVQSQSTGAPVYVNFGVHQESADEHIELMSYALDDFKKDHPDVIRFSTVTKVANAALGK
tara:strand:+ start:28916 stop:29932 length:1017 start_codon:yes stop_codon:yes gene_type:complete